MLSTAPVLARSCTSMLEACALTLTIIVAVFEEAGTQPLKSQDSHPVIPRHARSILVGVRPFCIMIFVYCVFSSDFRAYLVAPVLQLTINT